MTKYLARTVRLFRLAIYVSVILSLGYAWSDHVNAKKLAETRALAKLRMHI